MKHSHAVKAFRLSFRPGTAGFLRFCLLLGLALAPIAWAAAGIQVVVEQYREVEVVDSLGKKVKTLEKLTTAAPGEEVIYEISYANAGKEPADKVVVRNPLSRALMFQPGSMTGEDVVAEVSVDGGQTFGQLENLKVGDLPATPADVTEVRWVLQKSLAPGAKGKVTFRALVR